jgi:anti-sigma B factor antagonist
MASQPLRPPSKEEAANEVTVVHFTGGKVSLDEKTLPYVRDQLDALTEEPGHSRLVLDFGNVVYVAGRALGMLVGLHKKLLGAGRRLTVRNLHPQIYEVFVVTRLDKLLDLRLAKPRAWQVPEDSRVAFAPGVLVVRGEPAVDRSVLPAWQGPMDQNSCTWRMSDVSIGQE